MIPHPSPTTAKTEPEGVKVPAHVLGALSSADIAELVRLWNAGTPNRAKALAIADADCTRHWNRRKS
jgi:hypothetical protein